MASQTIIMGGVKQLQVPSVPVGMECTPWSTSQGLHQGLVTTHSWRLGPSCGQSLDGLHEAYPLWPAGASLEQLLYTFPPQDAASLSSQF